MVAWILIGIGYLFIIARKYPTLMDAMGHAMSDDDTGSEEHQPVVVN
jgi:hypothetical protein